ncbi:MAG TPA: hypothetical protein VE988_05225 [Gemmataceae bacterium]|nr:hypothetical protein [Gemmataceae bacterium]
MANVPPLFKVCQITGLIRNKVQSTCQTAVFSKELLWFCASGKGVKAWIFAVASRLFRERATGQNHGTSDKPLPLAFSFWPRAARRSLRKKERKADSGRLALLFLPLSIRQ